MIYFLKWGGALAAVLLCAVALLALTGRKTFHTEVFIPAPPDHVWAVLMDTASYRQWNPVFVNVEGEYREGVTVLNSVQDPTKILTIKARVTRLRPGRELRQSGGLTGILTFDHQWKLFPENGGTRLVQHEVDRGFYLWFWDSSWVQPAYERASLAVRDRVIETSGRDLLQSTE